MASFTIYGDVNVKITITESGSGTLLFQVDVLDETGSIGDLNALYFDLFDDSLTGSLTITGEDVTGIALKVDGVTKIDSYTTMNGEVIKEYGKFDGGVQFGTAGMAKDDIRSTTFEISSSTTALSLADFSLQDFGIRLTSVGTLDGSRDGSLKLGATAPEMESPAPAVAADDYLTVTENKSFSSNVSDALTDLLDTDTFQLIANDPDAGSVTTVFDDMGNAYEVDGSVLVTNSDGTMLRVYSDGTVSFSALDINLDPVYGALDSGQSATTTFGYMTDTGAVANLIITVNGLDDIVLPGGPGLPGDPGFPPGGF